MPWLKGSIVISAEGDIPLLREVRNARFVSRSQLFALLNHRVRVPTSTYNSRLRRLVARGYLRSLISLAWRGEMVLTIAPRGLMELESHGELNLVLHSGTRNMPHPLHAYHALDLNDIRIALVRGSLLAGWTSELEIASLNMVSLAFQKDYDAVVRIRAAREIREFALEYERSLKSAQRYSRIREAIEAERRVGAFVYLTACEELRDALRYHFSTCSRPLAFATAQQFRRHLMATPVLTHRGAVTFAEFLAHASGNDTAAPQTGGS